MKKFYLYEGTDENRDETDSFDTKAEAIKRAKIVIAERELDRQLFGWDHYTVYVIKTSTGEFVHTETTKKYIRNNTSLL